VQNHDNRYFVNVEFQGGAIRLSKLEGGNSTVLAADSTFALSENEWYELEVDWRKTGQHVVSISDCDGNQLAEISVTDTTWSDGGIGFDAFASSGGTVHYDHVAISKSVLDDFEDGDISEYKGGTGHFAVQSSVTLEGDQTLKGTSAPSAIAHSGVKTPRGCEYRASVMVASGSNAKAALMACVQDPSNPLNDCYYSRINPANNKISLYRREAGNDVLLNEEDVVIDGGKEYQLRINLRRNSIITELRDSNGVALKATGAFDSTLSGGYLGFFLTNGAPGYFDKATKHRRADSILENFEDTDINEYDGQTASYSVQTSVVLQGERTLKCDSKYAEIAHTSARTPREEEYRCKIMSGSGSAAQPGLLTCVQDESNPMDDCYWLNLEPDNNMMALVRRDAGASTTLDSVNVSIEEGEQYQLGMILGEQEIIGRIYEKNGRNLAETSAVSDNTYENGAFGFYTGGGAPAYYDYVTKISLLNRTSSDVSESEMKANKALNAPLTQDILSQLNNPATEPSSSFRRNFYREGKSIEFSFLHIPMEHGEIHVGYKMGR
jgi:hypothetical protein